LRKAKDITLEAEYTTVGETKIVRNVNPTLRDIAITKIKIGYVILAISFALSLMFIGITAIIIFSFIGMLFNILFNIGGDQK